MEGLVPLRFIFIKWGGPLIHPEFIGEYYYYLMKVCPYILKKIFIRDGLLFLITILMILSKIKFIEIIKLYRFVILKNII